MTQTQIRKAIDYYNWQVGINQIDNIENVTHKPQGFFHEERLIAIKGSVAARYFENHQLATA